MSIHTSISKNHTDIKSVVKKLTHRLINIINIYYPSPLPVFRPKVPFDEGSVIIELKKPVILPFTVSRYSSIFTSLIINIEDRPINKFKIYFTNKHIQKVVAYIPTDISFEAATFIDSIGDFGLAHFVWLYTHGIDEVTVKASNEEAGKWLKNFINAIDITSSITSTIAPHDIMNRNMNIRMLNVLISRPYKNLKTLRLVLLLGHESVKDASRLVITMSDDSGNVSEIKYYFRGETTLCLVIDLASNQDIDDVLDILSNISESDNIFNSIKRSLTSFLDAYIKMKVAYRYITI